MKEFLSAIFGVLERAQLEHITLATTLTLIGVVIWIGKSGVKRLTGSIESVRKDIKETNSRVDKVEKEMADFKTEIAKDYVSQTQLDRRIGGLKEMIAALTETVNEMKTQLAVFMAGGRPSVKRNPTKRKPK